MSPELKLDDYQRNLEKLFCIYILYVLILNSYKGTLLTVFYSFECPAQQIESFLNYLLFLLYCCVNLILILILICNTVTARKYIIIKLNG